MSIWKPQIVTGTIQGTTIDSYHEIKIGALGLRPIIIQRVQVQTLSGTAANYAPLVTNGDGVAAALGVLFEGSSVASGFFDVTDIIGWGQTDANGSIWVCFQPDAGSDNEYTYMIAIEVY